MARVETIVVGGGVGALSPFTVNRIPYISATDPPTIGATTVAAFTGANDALIISATPDTDPQPAATEPLRVVGGIISEKVGSSDSVILGRAIGAVATGSVAIGTQAAAASSGNVAIGNLASAASVNGVAVGGSANASANSCTAVGRGATASVAGATAIGAGASASAANAIALGSTVTASQTAAISVGANITGNGAGSIIIGTGISANALADNVVIAQGGLTARANWCVIHGGTPTNLSSAATPLVIVGGGAMTVTHAGNIVLGHGFTSFKANVFSVGGTTANSFIDTAVFGRGDTHTASLGGLTIRCTNGSGTNVAMGDITIIAPRGTGNAANGSVLLQSGVVGASGAVLQAARTGVAVNASATAGETDLLVYDVDNATLERVSVGAADSGGAGFKVLRIPN
jgi:hypothetical protein